MHLTTYLNFDGNCREAMAFYKECLGGELTIFSFGDMPGMLPPGADDAMKTRIMHSSLALKSGAANLMASDTMPGMPFTVGNNTSVSVHPDSVEHINKLWEAFSEGATIQHKLDDAPWGARYGMLTDKFGVQWMFNHEYPKQ